METLATETTASSAAPETFEIPQDPQANLEWRKTGELPAASAKAAKPKEDSTTSKPASPDKTGETAAASATAPQQEKAKRENSAASRLDEILADLKTAGLSPLELKTYKRQATAAAADTPAKAAPETTVNLHGLVEPVMPLQSDLNADGTEKYPTYPQLKAAEDKYFKDYVDFKMKLAVAEDRQLRAQEKQQEALLVKVADAKTRYGDQTEATLREATASIFSDQAISPVVKLMLNESAVLVDVMYVLGSKPEDLASFIDLAKTDPGKAIRKVAFLEQQVEQELSHGSAAAGSAKGEASQSAGRDESGKFVSQNTPAKTKPAAPPPAEELSTRGSAAPDPKDAALRNNDFAAFKAIEDREDLAKRRGA